MLSENEIKDDHVVVVEEKETKDKTKDVSPMEGSDKAPSSEGEVAVLGFDVVAFGSHVCLFRCKGQKLKHKWEFVADDVVDQKKLLDYKKKTQIFDVETVSEREGNKVLIAVHLFQMEADSEEEMRTILDGLGQVRAVNADYGLPPGVNRKQHFMWKCCSSEIWHRLEGAHAFPMMCYDSKELTERLRQNELAIAVARDEAAKKKKEKPDSRVKSEYSKDVSWAAISDSRESGREKPAPKPRARDAPRGGGGGYPEARSLRLQYDVFADGVKVEERVRFLTMVSAVKLYAAQNLNLDPSTVSKFSYLADEMARVALVGDGLPERVEKPRKSRVLEKSEKGKD
jgi:hypothetical protein